MPRPFNGGAEVRGAGNTSGSRTLENASYFRLKQAAISYNVSPSVLSKSVKFIKTVRVYAQGINLATWTAWSGYDPEFAGLGSGNNGVIPQARNYTVGLQIGF